MSGSGSGRGWRCALVIFAVISGVCVCGAGLYLKLKNKGLMSSSSSSSCAPCICHCPPPPSLSHLAPGLVHLFVKDCGKDDPDLKEEMEKQFDDLLSEELRLHEAVGKEHSQHMNITLSEARKSASQYQREAEKCNVATETCEGSRERAEQLLIRERKITALWERRAKLLGWESL